MNLNIDLIRDNIDWYEQNEIEERNHPKQRDKEKRMGLANHISSATCLSKALGITRGWNLLIT